MIATVFTFKPDKASMRAMKSNEAYDVTFTLVNPQPDILDIQWDIKSGVGRFSCTLCGT